MLLNPKTALNIDSPDIVIKLIDIKKRKITTITRLHLYLNSFDKKQIKSEISKKCASGVTITDNIIKVQGDKKEELREMLLKLGIRKENIKIGVN